LNIAGNARSREEVIKELDELASHIRGGIPACSEAAIGDPGHSIQLQQEQMSALHEASVFLAICSFIHVDFWWVINLLLFF